MNNEPFLEFEDYPSTDTPLSATNLNNMQISIANSISANTDNIGDLTNLTTTDKTDLVSAINEVNDKNIITASITSIFTLTASSTYLKLPLDTSISVGTKLTLDTTNHNIVIGAGVSKIKISAKVSFDSIASSGVKWLTIYKNNESAIANPRNVTGRDLIWSTDTLVEVQENDIIWLGVFGSNNDKIRNAIGYSNVTIEVVE